MNPAKFRWGILFILAGSLLLLNNLGRMEWWVWSDILSLWPLLLIAIGIEKIFQNTKFSFISYLSSIALAGAVIWAALGCFGWNSCFESFGGQTRYRIDDDKGAKRIVADIDMDDDDINLRGTGRYLFSSTYDGNGRPPEIDYKQNGDIANFKINERDGRHFFSIRRGGVDGFDVSLSGELPLVVDCSGDESNMKLDFRKLLLEDLTVDSDDGRVRIFAGNRVAYVKMNLNGDDPNYRLQFPTNSGLRFQTTDEKLGRYLTRIGLIEEDNYFISEGYDSLTPQFDIELSDDLSRLSIRYY
ncbi:MAG: hypothetical protein GY841_14110 [FCB group bacterium]|nr:hypothetical protein [FCB group bacterium]